MPRRAHGHGARRAREVWSRWGSHGHLRLAGGSPGPRCVRPGERGVDDGAARAVGGAVRGSASVTRGGSAAVASAGHGGHAARACDTWTGAPPSPSVSGVPHGSSARCGCGRGRPRSTRARPSPTQRASESPRNIVHITLGCRRPPCPCFRKMCGQAAARARCRPGDDGSWMDAAKARRGASLAGSLAVKPNNHRKRAGAGHVEAAGGVRDGDGQRWMELVVACVARGCSPRSDGRSDRMDGLWSVRAWGSRGVPREGP
jgi:hypothetical protein